MLNIINKMPGIDDANLYDHEDNLVYSSFLNDTLCHSDPECKNCHLDIEEMFPKKEKSYTIVSTDSDCKMNQKTPIQGIC